MIIDGGDGTYWAFATNGNGANVQTLRSTDLVSWEQGPDALPELPEWTAPGDVWAPEVIVHDADRFLMYYTTPGAGRGDPVHLLAVADPARGPVRDRRCRPLGVRGERRRLHRRPPVHRTPTGIATCTGRTTATGSGSTPGSRCSGWTTPARSSSAEPQRLFQQDQPWEGDLVEGPFVWERDGQFVMFYSANAYASAEYAVGIATADRPTGPFIKEPEPILVSNDVAAGPGHCALFAKDGKVWMVYHAWAPDAIGSDIPGRTMWLSEVTFGADGSVTVVPPTTDYPGRP